MNLQVDGSYGITVVNDNRIEVKLRRDRTHKLIADAYDYIAESEVRLAQANPSVTLSLVPRFVTLDLRFTGLNEGQDDVVIRVENMDSEKGGIDEFYGPGPHTGIETGRYKLTVEAHGYTPQEIRKNWNRGGIQVETVRFTRAVSE